jgi:hypothetical protein
MSTAGWGPRPLQKVEIKVISNSDPNMDTSKAGARLKGAKLGSKMTIIIGERPLHH